MEITYILVLILKDNEVHNFSDLFDKVWAW
jgi:hypothetical protein